LITFFPRNATLPWAWEKESAPSGGGGQGAFGRRRCRHWCWSRGGGGRLFGRGFFGLGRLFRASGKKANGGTEANAEGFLVHGIISEWVLARVSPPVQNTGLHMALGPALDNADVRTQIAASRRE
jgi:hypothetical protein